MSDAMGEAMKELPVISSYDHPASNDADGVSQSQEGVVDVAVFPMPVMDGFVNQGQ